MSMENMTPADLAAVTNNENGGNWFWIVILFLFAMMGGGIGGWGGNAGAAQNYVLSSDFANIERKIDGVNNGLCDGFYAQAQMNGNTNLGIANGFAQAELSRANQQAAMMQQMFGMQSAMQTGFCTLNTHIDAQTATLSTAMCENTRAILDALNAQRIEMKDAKIAEQNQTIFGLQLAASQNAQTSYLIEQLKT